MKKLISFIAIITLHFITTGAALAHPGHVTLEQAHGFLHAEHVFVLVGIIGIFIISVIIKKRL